MIKQFILASLVLAFVFLATPAKAQMISDVAFTYNNAPKFHTPTRKTYQRNLGTQRRYHKPDPVRTSSTYRDGRPRAWCGWWARQRLGVSNPNYNRAIAWLNYGHPTSPQVGAVVVWPHHVGIITGYDKRGWLVTSGNWNNRVATVPLSQMGRGVQGYRI